MTPMYEPAEPLRDALTAITGRESPDFVGNAYSCNDLTDQQTIELQDWCSMNARPEWSTGIGILEAAELLVEEAIANANIARPKDNG